MNEQFIEYTEKMFSSTHFETIKLDVIIYIKNLKIIWMNLNMNTENTNNSNKTSNITPLNLQFIKNSLLETPRIHLFVSPESHVYENLNLVKKENLFSRKNIIEAKSIEEIEYVFTKNMLTEFDLCLFLDKNYKNKQQGNGKCLAITYNDFLHKCFSLNKNSGIDKFIQTENDRFTRVLANQEKLQEKFIYANYDENDWMSNFTVLEQSNLYNDIEQKAQHIIKKYNLNAVYFIDNPQPASNSEKNANEILNRLNHIEKAIDLFMGKIGIKTEFFGFNGTISLGVEPLETHASFDASNNTISLPVLSDYKEKSENTYLLHTSSSVLHEWMHAIDFNVVNNIYNLKQEAHTNKKPNISRKNKLLFSAEQSEPFFIPSDEPQLYHSYFSIRDTVESFLTNNEQQNREQRNQEIIKSFIAATISDNWIEGKTIEQQEILTSEKAFISLRNSIFGNSKNLKSENFISFIKENNISLSSNEEHTLHHLISHPQFKLKMKNIIKESENLFNKSGNEYLKNSKMADLSANEKTYNEVKGTQNQEFYKISRIHKKSNQDLNSGIETGPFVYYDTMNYFQNPSEMFARYFEKNVFPFLNSNLNQKAKEKKRKIYPNFVDTDFAVKKDVILASVFGLEALAPVKTISSKVTKTQLNFNEVVKSTALTYEVNTANTVDNKEFLSKHINPSAEFKNLVKKHRFFIEEQAKTITTQSKVKP